MSNADYTTPDMGQKYRSSKFIYNKIMEVEKKEGLNGHLMLIHFGTDNRRTDKFYNSYLDKLIKRKNNGLIKVITGIRRCGKSYLLNNLFYHHLLESGVDADHIIRFAFDSADLDCKHL